MPLLLFPNRNAGRNRCWAWPGNAGARLKKRPGAQNPLIFPPESDASQHRTAFDAPPAPSEPPLAPVLPACTATGVLLNPHSMPIGRGARSALHPAISCLGAFRTPAVSARGGLRHAGIRKPAQNRKSHRGHSGVKVGFIAAQNLQIPTAFWRLAHVCRELFVVLAQFGKHIQRRDEIRVVVENALQTAMCPKNAPWYRRFCGHARRVQLLSMGMGFSVFTASGRFASVTL